jgi:hypothetical protein
MSLGIDSDNPMAEQQWYFPLEPECLGPNKHAREWLFARKVFF